ncbi:peptide deformylase [Haloactinopolyspora alba]|nr:peptide deformylase [Haloactinopolyspora alba]
MPIRIWGDPVLRTPCDPVTKFDGELQRLVDDMFETMYDAPGVGLAANQVGVSLRLFVYDVGDGLKGVVANPVLEQFEGEQVGEEGCLSVPGLAYDRRRAMYATVSGADVHGEPVRVAGEGLLARCFQHETDHINGEIYVDKLDRGERKSALKAIREADWAREPSVG